MVSAWLLPEHIADVLPARARHVERMRRSLLDVAGHYGFELVIPPLLEHLESLLSGTGRELDLRTFKFAGLSQAPSGGPGRQACDGTCDHARRLPWSARTDSESEAAGTRGHPARGPRPVWGTRKGRTHSGSPGCRYRARRSAAALAGQHLPCTALDSEPQ